MLHPVLLSALLDDEVVVINERLAGRGGTRSDTSVLVHAPALGDDRDLVLKADTYDSEPVGVFVSDEAGRFLPGSEWPSGLCQGEHPILNRPFICVRGTIDYHAHPSHIEDSWDRYRGRIRLPISPPRSASLAPVPGDPGPTPAAVTADLVSCQRP